MILDDNDLRNIKLAKDQGGKIWENEILVDVKRKIKAHFLSITDEQCCYCRKEMRDEFMMVIDIEHILPKSLFSDFMFELYNLSVSCKRCNMRIKGDRIDFLRDSKTILLAPNKSDGYLFIHPNLDDYFQNIDYIVNVRNNKKSIKYSQLTEKGEFTYRFFQLDKIEVNTLNEAQGIDVSETELSSEIPRDIAEASIILLNQL